MKKKIPEGQSLGKTKTCFCIALKVSWTLNVHVEDVSIILYGAAVHFVFTHLDKRPMGKRRRQSAVLNCFSGLALAILAWLGFAFSGNMQFLKDEPEEVFTEWTLYKCFTTITGRSAVGPICTDSGRLVLFFHFNIDLTKQMFVDRLWRFSRLYRVRHRRETETGLKMSDKTWFKMGMY